MIGHPQTWTAAGRGAVIAAFGLLAAGCVADLPRAEWRTPAASPSADARYGDLDDGSVVVPALDLASIDPDLLRREVAWRGREKPGSIVVVIAERRLYLITGEGRALSYAVGVGREEALNFQGRAVIGHKEKWPRWIPTESMIAQQPRYAPYAGGLEGGLGNPLGARALYLYRDGRDTYFRLHGTNDPQTIGQAVSSGCIRLFNHDIIDLYDRVSLGAAVTVLDHAPPAGGNRISRIEAPTASSV